MRTKELTVYTVDELSEDAFERAFSYFQSNDFYPWSDDNKAVLNAFIDIFPVKVSDWGYGYHNYINFEITCSDEIADLSGQRLSTYIWNNYKNSIFKGKYYSIYKNGKYYSRHSKIFLESNCPLTGYSVDDDILQPIIDFLNKPGNENFADLMNDCLHAWIFACRNDYEGYFSKENFREMCHANEWEFYENGKTA